jgi:predicted dehydrogenase
MLSSGRPASPVQERDMVQKADGMTYAPEGKPNPVVKAGEFRFAAMHLDHGHIYGMCNGLIEAGGELVAVHDPQPARVAAFQKKFPQARAAGEAEILEDPAIRLVAAAAVPCDRGPLGCRVMEHGKDYFTDKTPFTSLAQLAQARQVAARTGRRYHVYYSERLHTECAVHAGKLIAEGAIGRVVQVLGLGPHRLGDPATRPAWFFKRAQYGGILCDIGSHQIEQFLAYTGAKDATIQAAKVANYHHPQFPELEDFGDMTLVADNGATGYHRVDWLTPKGLRTWGDGRTVILGTAGYIEQRKYVNLGDADLTGDHLFLVNDQGEQHLRLAGQVGFPFFGQLIRDSLDGTTTAMTQAHAFKAAELCLMAQAQALKVSGLA